MVTRRVLAGAVVMGMAGVSFGQGGLPAWIDPPEGSVRFGTSIASGADVNGDGVNDIVIADPGYENESGIVGRWFVYSGATHDVLWSVVGPDVTGPTQSAFRFPMTFIDDLDGDEVADILVGRSDALERRGVVEVYSGRTGEPLVRFTGESTGDFVGIDVARLGDLNADDVDEFAFLEWGIVHICSGATGEIIDSLEVPYVRRIRNVGDTDGDLVADFAVGIWYANVQRQVRLYSGITRDLVWLTVEPGSSEDNFAYNMVAGHDLNGDSVPDILVTGRSGTSGNPPPRCWVASGTDGALSVVEAHSEPGGSKFVSWVALGDFNGDARVEPLFGYTLGAGGIRRVNVYDHAPGPQPIDHLVYTVDWPVITGLVFGTELAVADVNRDGCDDLILGSSNNSPVHIIGGSPMLLGHDATTYAAFGQREVQRGRLAKFAVIGDAVGRPVRLAASRRGNGCTFIPQLGICMDLDRPFQQIGQAVTGADGIARFSLTIPSGTTPGSAWLQSLDTNFPRRGPATSNVMRIEITE